MEFNDNMLECVDKFSDGILEQDEIDVDSACDMFYSFVRMAVNEKIVKRRCSETKYVSTDYDKNDKLTVMVNERTNNVLTSYSDFEIEEHEKHGYEKVATYSNGKLVEKYGKYKDWGICA